MRNARENRVFRRKAIKRPVTIETSGHIARSFMSTHNTCMGLNMSSGGICIATKCQLLKNEIVKVGLCVDDDINLQIYSEVMWVSAYKGEYRAGLQFL